MVDIARLAIEIETGQVRASTTDLQRLSQASGRASQSTTSLSNAARASSGNFRNTALQLSQVAQQASATGNILQAFAIQLPDLAVGLGTFGILAGAAAGGIVSLYLATRDAETSFDSLSDSVNNLNGNFEEAENGSLQLTEELRRLAEVSRAAAQLRISVQTQEASEALENIRSLISETLADTLESGQIIGAVGFQGIIERSAVAASSFENLRFSLGLAEGEITNLVEAFRAASDSSDPESYNQLSQVVLDLRERYGDSNEAINELSASLSQQLPLAINAAEALDRLTQSGENFDSVISDATSELISLQTEITSRQYDASPLSDFFQSEADRIQDAQNRFNRLIREDLITTFTAEEEAAQRFAERIAEYDRLRREDLVSEQQYQQGRIAAEQAYNQRLIDIQSAEADQRLSTNQGTLQASENLFGNLANIAEAGGREQFDNYKALASAQAAIGATLAVINTLANPNIPYPLNIGLASSIGALAAVQVAQIQAQEYQGSRQLGGQVQSGRSFLVGETGPEILTMGAQSGFITPNNQIGGSQSNTTVNVIEDALRAGTQESQQIGQEEIVSIFVDSIRRGGPASRAVEQAFGVRRAGR